MLTVPPSVAALTVVCERALAAVSASTCSVSVVIVPPVMVAPLARLTFAAVTVLACSYFVTASVSFTVTLSLAATVSAVRESAVMTLPETSCAVMVFAVRPSVAETVAALMVSAAIFAFPPGSASHHPQRLHVPKHILPFCQPLFYTQFCTKLGIDKSRRVVLANFSPCLWHKVHKKTPPVPTRTSSATNDITSCYRLIIYHGNLCHILLQSLRNLIQSLRDLRRVICLAALRADISWYIANYHHAFTQINGKCS